MNPRQNGATRCVPTYRNGCKNSEKISWMIEFLNAETLTPVLLTKYLWNLREVDLGKHSVNTHFTKKTEIARSAREPKLQNDKDSLYKLRIRESEKLKTVLELYDLEIHQKKLGPDCHRLKTMVKKKYRARYTK